MKVKPIDSSKGWRGMLAKVTYRQWLLIAAAASCLLGILVYIWLPGGESQPVPFQQSSVIRVVRAAQDIPERTEITESMLEVLEVPEDMVPAGALRRTAEVLGKTAGIAIMKGDILTSRKLLESQMAGFVGSRARVAVAGLPTELSEPSPLALALASTLLMASSSTSCRKSLPWTVLSFLLPEMTITST